MEIGLRHLIDDRLAGHVEEIHAFVASRGVRAGPSTAEEVHAARALERLDPAVSGPPASEEIAEANGREVPVRILTSAHSPARGVYLDIHGSPHGFTLHPTGMADAAWRDIETWLRGRL